jgi:hypothetical protein
VATTDGGTQARPRSQNRAEQIGEQLVGKQPVPLPRQEPVDRVLRQRLLAEPGRIIEQVDLAISTPQRHPEILPRRTPNRATNTRKTPAT